MRTSEQIDQIVTALAAAQGEFPKIGKNKQASVKGVAKASGREYSIGYNYADIADVISAIAPVLSKHGIAYIQPTVLTDNGMLVCTRIMHKSGQWIESDYPVSGITGDHQKMGGALTYARRYSLSTMIGVAAEEDVDGECAADMPPPRRKIEEQKSATIASKSEDHIPFNDDPPDYSLILDKFDKDLATQLHVKGVESASERAWHTWGERCPKDIQDAATVIFDRHMARVIKLRAV
jgi:hypothetical protein